MASIIDWIKWPFGFLLRESYNITHSYAIAILIFAVVIRLVLLPFGIKQQKGLISKAKLYPKELKIKNKYKGREDKVTQQKMQTELMELYQNENYSPLSGCLPLLLQLPIILILFYVVTAPVSYVFPQINDSAVYFVPERSDEAYNPVDEFFRDSKNGLVCDGAKKDVSYMLTKDGKLFDVQTKEECPVSNISTEKLNEIRKNAISHAMSNASLWLKNGETENKANNKNKTYSELYFVQTFKNSDEDTQNAIVTAIPEAEALKEFNTSLLGLDLLETPKLFNWLLLIPVISVIVSYLSSYITKKLNGMAQDPAGTDAAKSTKIMELGFPLISGYIAFIVPGSVGFYWLLSNVIMILQSLLLSKLMPIPKLEEIEAEYNESEKLNKKMKKSKNSAPAIEVEAVDKTENTSDDMPSISKGRLKE